MPGGHCSIYLPTTDYHRGNSSGLVGGSKEGAVGGTNDGLGDLAVLGGPDFGGDDDGGG